MVGILLCLFYLDIDKSDERWSEFFMVDRLVNNIGLPEAYIMAIELLGVRIARCDVLRRLLCLGDEGVVVKKTRIARKMPMFWPRIQPGCFQAIFLLEDCARYCKMALCAELMQEASIVITVTSSLLTMDSFPCHWDHPNSSIDVAMYQDLITCMSVAKRSA